MHHTNQPHAVIAQLVEHQLPKLRVASSSLVYRSTENLTVSSCKLSDFSLSDIHEWARHSDGHDTTNIYIREDMRKVDEANRRVIDRVLYGNG